MDKLSLYISSHTEPEPSCLSSLVRQSNLRLIHPRMLSGHVQGRVLKMLVRMIKPKRVLELGAFAGYSAICIAEGLPSGSILDTIEYSDELESFLTDNINTSGYGDIVKVYIGDCLEVIAHSLKDNVYDLVFIDADKRDYIAYYEAVLPIVSTGGFIIADNVLWDGHVVDEKIKPNDLQTQGIIAFNDYVHRDTRVENVIFPIRDGLMILQKK